MVLCRFCSKCIKDGEYKDIRTKNVYLGKKISVMIEECFGISISFGNSNVVCNVCIKSLHDSISFKELILKSERNFYGPTPIKKMAALKKEADEEFEDHFAKDLSPETYDPNETKIVKTKHKESKISKRTVSTNMHGSKKEKRPYCTKGEFGKHMMYKQLQNLQTILNYSNAVPFKHKPLLGYVCGYCKKPFPDPFDLRHHIEQAHSEDRQYIQSNMEIRHFTVNLDITDLTCGICQLKVLDLKQLKKHLVETHEKSFHDGLKDHFLQFKLLKEDKYKCALCPSSHETFKMLKQHMNVHYSNYMCNQCGTPFVTWTSLQVHKESHFKGSFKCPQCDKVFTTRSRCKYHQKMIHTSKPKTAQKCPHCDEHFQNYYRRNQHMVLVHNSEMLYKCNVCGKGFFLKTYLMNHIKKNHLMERNHQCTQCEMKFFDTSRLSNHMLKHTTEKIHQCQVCSKSYKSKSTLVQHMHIHNEHKRFQCQVCLKSFNAKCSLKSHLSHHHTNDVLCTT